MAVRIAKFEVYRVIGEPYADVTKRWWVLADESKQAVNLIWETWLVWHVENGSAAKIRTWLSEYKAWKEAKGSKADRPNRPIDAIPKELMHRITATLATELPGAAV